MTRSTSAAVGLAALAAAISLAGCAQLSGALSPHATAQSADAALAIVADPTIFYQRREWESALRSFVPTLCTGDMPLALIRIEDGKYGHPLQCALTPGRNDRPRVSSALTRMLAVAPPHSGSDVVSGLEVGKLWLNTQRARRKILLVFTDGICDPRKDSKGQRTLRRYVSLEDSRLALSDFEVHFYGVPVARINALRGLFPHARIYPEGATFDPATLHLATADL